MKNWFSLKTFLEVLALISVNLASGWLGVILIAPGFVNTSVDQYYGLLINNAPFATVGLLAALLLTEKAKRA